MIDADAPSTGEVAMPSEHSAPSPPESRMAAPQVIPRNAPVRSEGPGPMRILRKGNGPATEKTRPGPEGAGSVPWPPFSPPRTPYANLGIARIDRKNSESTVCHEPRKRREPVESWQFYNARCGPVAVSPRPLPRTRVNRRSSDAPASPKRPCPPRTAGRCA